MSEINPITGLPKDLFTEEELGQENTRIKIYSKKANFDKTLTIVEGIPKDNMERVYKELKRRLSCGGTIKNGYIELQGDHKQKLKKHLVNLGFDENKIEIVL